jgi:hypothetical protein
VEVQLATVRRTQIKMQEETREDVLEKGKARRGSQHDGSFRDEHKIFVIGQWSFVIGHLNEK